MKKILIATTALVATASVAAAELNLSGNARFGLGYVEDAVDAAGRDAETRIEQRFRFQVQGVAETDAGVKFEARIRAEAGEDVDNSISGGGFGAAGFAVSAGGFRLDVGNVSDVIDSGDAVNYFGTGVGLTAFLEYNATSNLPGVGGFSSGDQEQTTIKLRYTAGDFTVAASYSNNKDVSSETTLDAVAATATTVVAANDLEEFQIGVGYSFGNYNVGAAYVNVDGDVVSETTVVDAAGTTTTSATAATDIDGWVISFDGSVGDFGFGVQVSDADGFDTSYGIFATYDVSAATEIRFVAAGGGDASDGSADKDTAVGIGFSHSLGGGVTLAGGIGQNTADKTVADLGVSFSF